MTNRYLLLIWFLSFAQYGFASGIVVGSSIEAINIADKGEIVLKNDSTAFQIWNSTSLIGKVTVLQHLAARLSASKLNQSFYDALNATQLPKDRYNSVTLLNIDDALWGSTFFVMSELKRNKKKYPHAVLVADARGKVRRHWQLAEQSSAIVMLDNTGKVIFFRDGKLSDQDIQRALQLLKQALQ